MSVSVSVSDSDSDSDSDSESESDSDSDSDESESESESDDDLTQNGPWSFDSKVFFLRTNSQKRGWYSRQPDRRRK